MDNYIVSARKYRPSTFKSVVGQKALTATLKNAITTGRLAHSYLFCGSRGVGKTSCARIFAKTINCEHLTPEGEACNECDSCRAFNNGNSLNIIELDAASNNGVDDMRAIVDQVQIPPATGKYRVFIVDEVHMLTTQAFNAFLKTLEEPPHYVIFILATTEKHKILPTILSRCQIYDFSRITVRDIVDHLKYVASQEGFSTEDAALSVIAKKADGAMRDALSIFDQVAASTEGNLTYKATIENLNVLDHNYYNHLLEDFLRGDVLDSWLTYKEIRDRGFDSHFFINGLADYMRDLMVASTPQSLSLLETDDEARQAMATEAQRTPAAFLLRAMSLLNDADLNFRNAANKQFLVELTLAKICQIMAPLEGMKPTETVQPLKPINVAPTSVQPVTQSPSQPQKSQISEPIEEKKEVPSNSKSPIAEKSGYTPKRVTNRRATATIKISSQPQQETSGQDSATQVTEPKENSPFTDEDFERVWESASQSADFPMSVKHTMKLRKPIQLQDGHYKIQVVNEIEQKAITDNLPKLLKSLREGLHNDSVVIETEIHAGEPSPMTWNESQVLQHFMTTIPGMPKMVQELNLTTC